MNRQTAKVRVRVVVEVSTSSAWGPDCTIGQVYAQGASGAVKQVARALNGLSGARVVEASACEVVVTCEGKP